MYKLTLSLLVFAAVVVSGCSERPATEPETKAAEAVLDKFAEALETQDLASISELVSHDPNMVYFGFNHGERWVGYQALETAVRNQMNAYENLRLIPHDRVVTIGPDGETAWFSELLDWNMMTAGEPVSMRDVRFTGTLERVNGAWRIVQYHLSLTLPSLPSPWP